jgi:flagellar motor switch protein FliM
MTSTTRQPRLQIDAKTLRMLLQSARNSTVRQGPSDAEEFDLRIPHRFSQAERKRLEDFTEITSRNLTATISSVFRSAFRVSLAFHGEEFGAKPRKEYEGRTYYIPIRQDEQICGFFQIPGATAIPWVTIMLGGLTSGPVDGSRDLSSLETDLLLDMCTNMIESITSASQEEGGLAFEIGRELSILPLEIEHPEQILEYYRMDFERFDPDDKVPFSVVILSRFLEPIAGYTRPADLSAQQLQGRMRTHLSRVRMPVKVRVDRTDVTMRDVAALQEGDILLLDTLLGQPMKVIASGKTLMLGQPVTHRGRYALQVQRFADPDEDQDD